MKVLKDFIDFAVSIFLCICIPCYVLNERNPAYGVIGFIMMLTLVFWVFATLLALYLVCRKEDRVLIRLFRPGEKKATKR